MKDMDPEIARFIVNGTFQIITWLIVICGWIYVDRRNNNRESRKERRDDICKLKNRIEKIIDNAIQYHTNASHDQNLSREIKIQIDLLATSIQSLKNFGIRLDSSMVVAFRKAVTYHNFDTHSFTKRPHYDPLILEIQDTGTALATALDVSFINKYPR